MTEHQSPVAFVYPYYAAGAKGEELRYSIRSIARFFQGRSRVWVVGDRPEWYSGSFVHAPHVGARQRNARLDRAAKLWRIVKVRDIPEEFIWMMDDIYFVGPVTMEELRRFRSDGQATAKDLGRKRTGGPWQQQKRRTWQALQERGRPLHDYAAHMPVSYTKTHLRLLFRIYNLERFGYVDDLLYGNEFYDGEPRSAEEVRYRECGKPDEATIWEKLKGKLFFNHGNRAYTPAVQRVLRELLPCPSAYEHGAT